MIQIRENLKKLGVQFEETDFQQIISKVKQSKLNKKRQGEEIHIIEWNTNFMCWNMVNPELNQNTIWLQLSKYSPQELVYIKSYLARYEAFFEKCQEYNIVDLGSSEIPWI